MPVDLISVCLRNMLALQLLAVLVLAGAAPVLEQELLKIWKTLNTPLLPNHEAKTNHKSNRFWEIDMTKFEP